MNSKGNVLYDENDIKSLKESYGAELSKSIADKYQDPIKKLRFDTDQILGKILGDIKYKSTKGAYTTRVYLDFYGMSDVICSEITSVLVRLGYKISDTHRSFLNDSIYAFDVSWS